ncbi:hypothetical protein BDW02DRAFT_484031, partial [Decorospora gaudefroyi]
DPFTSLLTLEDTLYTTAYTLGTNDGSRAGRIEGRLFGLENGFEKFASLGQLHGRSVVWAARLQGNQEKEEKEKEKETEHLPTLASTSRLHNNISLLHALTDPETFDTANTDDAVADFDDRFKRAGAKAKVVERIVGETQGGGSSVIKSPEGSPARGKSGPVRVTGGAKKGKKGDDNMEDFAGSRLLR